MASKQYADTEFMTEYSSYLKEHALDPIARTIDFDGTRGGAALHLPPQCDNPYLIMTSSDGTKSMQFMTDGSYAGADGNRGMGIRFKVSDGSHGDYGNLSLKAAPTHGWDRILTLPNETGILATRNYVDDAISNLGTPYLNIIPLSVTGTSWDLDLSGLGTYCFALFDFWMQAQGSWSSSTSGYLKINVAGTGGATVTPFQRSAAELPYNNIADRRYQLWVISDSQYNSGCSSILKDQLSNGAPTVKQLDSSSQFGELERITITKDSSLSNLKVYGYIVLVQGLRARFN